MKEIRIRLWIMIAGLFLSGITAFPINSELKILQDHTNSWPWLLRQWIAGVNSAVSATNSKYPFLSYGTDWLAFAHILLAVLFAGALKDPVKNRWVIEFGIIASISIFPLAFIAGGIRQIPVFWQLIDCSFGVAGLIVLLPCYRKINRLEKS